MAQPPLYSRAKDFTADAADSTDHAALNAELDNASSSINAICTNLAILQGDDGALRADSVTIDAIDDSAVTYLAAGVRLEMQNDFQNVSDAASASQASATLAASSASDAVTSASEASQSAVTAGQYRDNAAQIKSDVETLAASADDSVVAASGHAQLAYQYKEDAALNKYQAQLAAEAAGDAMQVSAKNADDTEKYKDEAVLARDDAREWGESASASAASAATSASAAASSAATAANSAQQANQLVQECTHIRDDARLAAVAAASSANTSAESATAAATSASGASGSSTAAATSANASLTAANASGAHAVLAEASKNAAAASANASAASAAEAIAAAGQAKESAQVARLGIMSATAGGTPDVITACFKGGVSEPPRDHLIMYVRAIGANETTTPTFKPGSATPRVIVKGSNQPLLVGDICGAGYEMILQYNAEYDRFVLLNPAFGVMPSGRTGKHIGEIFWFGGKTPPPGSLNLCMGRNTQVPVATYQALADTVYCGDAYNDDADFYYRCDNIDGTGRNTAGDYLSLPDMARQFVRGRYATDTVDNYKYQGDAIRNITGVHRTLALNNLSSDAFTLNLVATGGGMAGIDANHYNANFDASRVVPTADENRPMNIPGMWCIHAYDEATYSHTQVDIAYLINQVNSFEARKADRAETFGIDQVWQDVTSQRAAFITYQNPESKPIAVGIMWRDIKSPLNSGASLQVSADGINWVMNMTGALAMATGGTFYPTNFGIVPPGHYYRVIWHTSPTSQNVILNFWSELRGAE